MSSTKTGLDPSGLRLVQDTPGDSAQATAVAHDLRTHLQAVFGYAELLLEGASGDLPPVQRHCVERILIAASSMDAIIRRLASGTSPSVRDPGSLYSIAASAIALLEPLAQRRGVVVALDGDAPTPIAIGHERLMQLALNLVTHAVRYTSANGETRVTVGQSKNALTLAVEYPGTDESGAVQLDRLEPSTDHAGSASPGDRLGVIRGLAAALGGDLHVQPSGAHGSRIVLTLPRGEAQIALATSRVEPTDVRISSS